MAKGIYRITNKVNGMTYVGATLSSFEARWKTHRSQLNNGTHINCALQADWLVYSQDAFAFIAIEIINDQNYLRRREQSWIDYYAEDGLCYNLVNAPVPSRKKRLKIH